MNYTDIISMCIIKKVFYYEETELPVIKYKDDIWFRGKTIAEILKYANQRKQFAIMLYHKESILL